MVQEGKVDDLVGVAILADVCQIVDKTDCIMVSPGVKKDEAKKIGFRYAKTANEAPDDGAGEAGGEGARSQSCATAGTSCRSWTTRRRSGSPEKVESDTRTVSRPLTFERARSSSMTEPESPAIARCEETIRSTSADDSRTAIAMRDARRWRRN